MAFIPFALTVGTWLGGSAALGGTVIAAAGGLAAAGLGQIKSGLDQAAGAEYNAEVALANAEAVKKAAAFESETLATQSKLEQEKIARQKQKTLSTQRAIYSKSGVQFFEGSPLEVMADTATQYEYDIDITKYNLAVGLENIRFTRDVNVSNLQSQAISGQFLGKQYKSAGYWGAGSTLLTGGAKVASYAGQGEN